MQKVFIKDRFSVIVIEREIKLYFVGNSKKEIIGNKI